MDKRRTTTKDVALLLQLRDQQQLTLAPEFQRNSVWPRPAKAYLIDTILSDRPIPLLFFSRAVNAQTGRPEFEVIDGQQRLRAVFDFYDNRFSLTESDSASPWVGKKWRSLDDELRGRILDYDFVVEELSGYSDYDIRDMFRRMNRYVVKLNAQEQRHAIAGGLFKEFAEEVGSWQFWVSNGVFSVNAAKRRRTDEFAAEIAILLLEGPQDKKATLDIYFTAYEDNFPLREDLRERLLSYLELVQAALPDLKSMQLRRPANLYALIGALDLVSNAGEELDDIDPQEIGPALAKFDAGIQSEDPSGLAARYVRAASRQTDNINPRRIRIEALATVIKTGF